ncbi:putative interferon-related developmental regulator 1-like [Capsicum annuum]|uniref:KIB1-4 beta-propeller domain-containing protein n=1 Tax=Capsicum annuum TaxID=4072 RepID=A0A2G2Y3B6_CAPAN|nr:putative interferon-related developmental regulator 1-like [Capsicum annuum]PHT64224.1 hypothetical protein T459_31894 [Capsicum annuum]
MGHQKKEEKLDKPQEKAKSFVEPWPNLPQQLLNFIGRQQPNETGHLMQNISFFGVTKSWRAAPKQCSANTRFPWLEIADKDYYQYSKTQEHTLNIPLRPGEYWWFSRRPWDAPWTHFHGCSHGLIVAGGKDPAEYCLLIPTEGNCSYWTIPFKFATLSSKPYNNYKSWSVLVLTGCSYPLFVVFQPGYKWMKQTRSLVDPNCSKRQLMILTNAVGFEGKFSLLGTLVVIEGIKCKFQITKLSRSRAVPSVFSKHFKEYLLESNGEILLIFLISEQSTRKVDKVEVFKLRMDDHISWLKLDNLGNRTLFAGTNCCMDMTPNDKMKQKISSKEESSYVEPWQNLPEKLLNFLKKPRRVHSNLRESIGPAGVTKSWRCASKKCGSIAKSPWLELSNEPQYYCKTQQHTFNLSFADSGFYWWHGRTRPRYDPWKHFHCYSPLSILDGKKIPIDYCFLNSSRGRYGHWGIPPSDRKKPFSFPYSIYSWSCCCFPKFVVYHLGQNQKWMNQECNQNGLIDPNDPKGQLIQFSNAIFFDRKFYALTLQGTLAVIQESQEYQFQVTRLSRKQAIPSNYSKHFIEYFLESDGEILLIFLISEGSNRTVDKVEVFKLQIEDLSWLKLDNLGDRTLFAGINCCISVPASQIGCRNNCVYFTHRLIDGWRIYDMRSGCIAPCYDDTGCEVANPVWEEPITGKSSRRRKKYL